MFFDIGWSEFLLIGVIALVVIGPKDLPAALRVAGYWLRKARTLSREFHSSVEQMIRDSEIDEMRKELRSATDFDIEHEVRKAVDPDRSLEHSISAPEAPDYFEPPPIAAEPVPLEAAETAALPEAGLPVADPPPVHGFDPEPEPTPDG